MLTVYKRFCTEVRKVVYSDVILGMEYSAVGILFLARQRRDRRECSHDDSYAAMLSNVN